MVSFRTTSAIAAKHLAMREKLWPGSEHRLWNRKLNKGFTTIPKTMPLILKIIDEITKGAPASSTYLALWCATFDNSLVNLAKPTELAYASGFGGQRDRHTWAARMKALQKLGFIDIAPGRSGPMSFAIIWNPHYVIRDLMDAKTLGLTAQSFNGLLEHADEIGAKDMTDGPPPPQAPIPPHILALMSKPGAPPPTLSEPVLPTAPAQPLWGSAATTVQGLPSLPPTFEEGADGSEKP